MISPSTQRNKIKILLSCEITLFRKGLKLILEKEDNLIISGEAINKNQIFEYINKFNPDILIINLELEDTVLNSLCKNIHEKYPKLPILLFLENLSGISIAETIINGVRGIIWNENTNIELIEAINKVASGKYFFENPDHCRLGCHFSEKIHKNPKIEEADLNISHREYEVLKLIAEGLTYKEIASRLSISGRTVEAHKNSILRKLNLNTVNQLIRFAIINGII